MKNNMNKILIATKNNGKVAEFQELFKKYDMQTISLLDLPDDIEDVEETGETFEENARLKAEQISSILNAPVLADDSGLIIDALDGRPGVFSARYAGLAKNDQDNNNKVLNELKNVPIENRTARFICVLAVSRPGEETFFVTGYCEGKIAFSEMGSNGFGYDPIFIPKGYSKTMAEISAEEKNVISHRGQAIKELDQWLKKYIK